MLKGFLKVSNQTFASYEIWNFPENSRTADTDRSAIFWLYPLNIIKIWFYHGVSIYIEGEKTAKNNSDLGISCYN